MISFLQKFVRKNFVRIDFWQDSLKQCSTSSSAYNKSWAYLRFPTSLKERNILDCLWLERSLKNNWQWYFFAQNWRPTKPPYVGRDWPSSVKLCANLRSMKVKLETKRSRNTTSWDFLWPGHSYLSLNSKIKALSRPSLNKRQLINEDKPEKLAS